MKRKTASQKRRSALERKYLDRAILRLALSLWTGKETLDAGDQRELLGLVMARRRVP